MFNYASNKSELSIEHYNIFLFIVANDVSGAKQEENVTVKWCTAGATRAPELGGGAERSLTQLFTTRGGLPKVMLDIPYCGLLPMYMKRIDFAERLNVAESRHRRPDEVASPAPTLSAV